jgi:hypothetical protein
VVPGVTSESEVFLGGASGIGSEITVTFGGANLISDGVAMSDGEFISNSLNLG